MFEACIPDQSKVDIRNGIQSDDEYKIALYHQAEATDKNRSATIYNSIGELPTAGGYLRGGKTLAGFSQRKCAGDPGAGDEVWIDFADPVWPKASFGADAAVIYNASKANKILIIVAFGQTAVTGGTFTVELSTPHLPLIAILPDGIYGPGDRELTSGGLRPRDVSNLADLALVSTISDTNLSDEERSRRLEGIHLRQQILHYRFPTKRKHSSETL